MESLVTNPNPARNEFGVVDRPPIA